jgi:DNA repair protein RecO (recombination protein O)
MNRSSHRVQLTRAYVLHQRPFRDSSLIVEVFAREFGRMTLFARAARGPRSRFVALQPFQALLLSWSGRGEAPQLTATELAEGGPVAMPSRQLMSAFYLNELLLTLTTRHDPHPELFDHYGSAVADLGQGRPADVLLRRFEARLLDFIGYGLNLDAEADTGQPVRAEAHYHFRPGVHGVVLAAAADVDGESDLRQARALMRAAIDHCLEGRELRTRAVARSLASYPRKEQRL